MADNETSTAEEVRAGIASDVIRSIKKFRYVKLSLLEAEILARLIDGRRTSNELVLEIYGSSKNEPGYVADYYKVRRAIRNLARSGYVSAPLFAKEKPYRLTQHGIASLTMIGGRGQGSPRVIPRRDIGLYSVSIGLAAATVLASRTLGPSSSIPMYLAGAFLITIGTSLLRIYETFMRVT